MRHPFHLAHFPASANLIVAILFSLRFPSALF
jgi:hypothetical protein